MAVSAHQLGVQVPYNCKKPSSSTLDFFCLIVKNLGLGDCQLWFSCSTTSRPMSLILLSQPFPSGLKMISLGPAFQRGWVPVCLSIFLLGKLRNFPSRFPLKFHWPKLSHTAAIAAEAAKVENSPTIMTHFGGFSLLPPEKIGILFSCEAVGK